jgi:hypothetical protein
MLEENLCDSESETLVFPQKFADLRFADGDTRKFADLRFAD